jgi:hypothetical protein
MTRAPGARPGEGALGRWVWADLVRVVPLFAVVLLNAAAVPVAGRLFSMFIRLPVS